MTPMTPFGEESGAAKVFGETPKTAVETTALPPKQLNRSGLVVSGAIGCDSLQLAAISRGQDRRILTGCTGLKGCFA
jgi:hypothetical protein